MLFQTKETLIRPAWKAVGLWMLAIMLFISGLLVGSFYQTPVECPECEDMGWCHLDDKTRDIYIRLDQCLLENQ